jgi:hypothetical protein
MRNQTFVALFAVVLGVGAAGCEIQTADGPLALGDDSIVPPTFSIGGTVAGLAGPLVLQNSNGTHIRVMKNGSFSFDVPMVPSALYNVMVAVPPKGQICMVANGSGTVARADIRDVSVTCHPTRYTAAKR